MLKTNESIKKDDLIYWIDKWFVQETAKERIGRELDKEELQRFTKMIEFGLLDAVMESTRTALDFIVEEEN